MKPEKERKKRIDEVKVSLKGFNEISQLLIDFGKSEARKETVAEVAKFEIDLYGEKFIIINPEDWEKLQRGDKHRPFLRKSAGCGKPEAKR